MNIFKSKINTSKSALVTLQESFNELNETYSNLQTSFKEVSELSVTYKEEFERVDSENKLNIQTIEELKQEIAEVSKEGIVIEEAVAERAIELIAESGHPQIDIVEEAEEVKEMDIVSVFKTLKGKALQEFYSNPENKKAINTALKGGK